MHILWDTALGEYARIAKNLVEEGTELFGYTLRLNASIGYCFCSCLTGSNRTGK